MVKAKWSKVLLLGALATLGLRLLAALAQAQKQRGDISDNLTRWEDEGGHVPDVEPPHVSAAPQRSPHPL